ncbi:hypothetical protein UMZ34_11065 [Halopseudomonas pachastrellae]|nr:hypothetical protein UMZ34_11065 [Halopseudomonas pachastrellae]
MSFDTPSIYAARCASRNKCWPIRNTAVTPRSTTTAWPRSWAFAPAHRRSAHFSQFTPLLVEIWGQQWFEKGCFSSHFQNMVVEGEQVRAFVERPAPGQTRVRCWAEKADGTPVLEASASIGAAPGESLLYERMAKLRAPEKLVILSDLHVGMKGAVDEKVRMDPDQNMGKLYPFSLNQKLVGITETPTGTPMAAARPGAAQ